MADDKVNFVGILMEFKNCSKMFYDNSIITKDGQWLRDRSWLVDLRGPSKDFLNSLGEMEKCGCTQRLISLLKYARDHGAAWAKF